MRWISVLGGWLVDAVVYPLRGLSPAWGLTAISLLTGLLFLFVFKWTSDQAALARAKDRVKAHLLELLLYAHDLALSLRAQRDLFLANLMYVRRTLVPIAVLIVPAVLLLVQLDVRYGMRPFEPGETALLRVRLSPTVPEGTEPELRLPEGIALDAPPLWLPSEREMNWRLSAIEEGDHTMTVAVAGREVPKRMRVGGPLRPVAPEVRQPSLFSTLLEPAEPPLDRDGPVQAIFLDYPARDISVLGHDVHWLVFFLVVSIVPAYLLKGLFGIEV